MTMWQRMMTSELLNSRAGRAGAIFNPLYGLRLLSCHPISPFTGPQEEEDDGRCSRSLSSHVCPHRYLISPSTDHMERRRTMSHSISPVAEPR